LVFGFCSRELIFPKRNPEIDLALYMIKKYRNNNEPLTLIGLAKMRAGRKSNEQ